MPSTSAKQHRFMAAIAHSPSFAKKVGVSQSVGKDFTAADKGKTFKKGGMMKKRRFDEGGEIDYEVDENAEPERRSFAAGVSRKAEAPKAKSFAKTSSKPISDTSDMGPQEAPEDTRAVSGMASRKYKFKGTDVDKERNATNLAKELATTAVLGGAGKLAQNVYRGVKAVAAAKDWKNLNSMSKANEAKYKAREDWKNLDSISKANEAKYATREASARNRLGDKDIEDFKKGGMMKESKAMVGKEVAFFKKKGAPASMIKHEKAEMKGYARGGGIESKGKTQGTMIKMATGGSVSRRADGIAQRGKTKFKNC
jgi:hypothetical protein